jgi:hypothetical protein
VRYPKAQQTIQTGATHRRGWLVELINRHHWRHGAELGACKGKTLFYLIDHCPELHMIGVDLWAAQPGNPVEDYTQPHWRHEWAANHVKAQARKTGRVRIIHEDTVNAAAEVANQSLDFVFIDADHGRAAEDITAWRPKLKPQGKLIGHDINWPSVKADVDRVIRRYDIGPDNCWIEK